MLNWMMENWVALIGIVLGVVNLERSSRQESVSRVGDRNAALKVAVAHRDTLAELHKLTEQIAKIDPAESEIPNFIAKSCERARERCDHLRSVAHVSSHDDHISLNKLKGDLEAEIEENKSLINLLRAALVTHQRALQP